MSITNESEYSSLLKKTIEKFGNDAQLDQAIEECSELILALCKYKRYSDNITEEIYDNVIEEIADVQIMIDQLKFMFDEKVIEQCKEKKINKLIKIINNS